MGRNNFIKKVLKKVYKDRKKENENKKTNSIPERETGNLIPEEYRMDYLKWCCEESEKTLQESRERLLESTKRMRNIDKNEFFDSLHSPKEIDHQVAEENVKSKQNKTIDKEISYILAEVGQLKRFSKKILRDKVIIAYLDKNNEEIVMEYTKEELLKRAEQREQDVQEKQ